MSAHIVVVVNLLLLNLLNELRKRDQMRGLLCQRCHQMLLFTRDSTFLFGKCTCI